jgi:hypothetical protein
MRLFGAFLAGAVADPFPRRRGPFPAAGKDFHPPTAKRVFFPALRCECAPNPLSSPFTKGGNRALVLPFEKGRQRGFYLGFESSFLGVHNERRKFNGIMPPGGAQK